MLSTERVGFHPRVGPGNNRGVFIHPEYDLTRNQPFDIALIRLAGAFEIQPMMQTVGLPTAPVVGGVVGNLANYRHNATLPEGHVAVFRAPMPP